MDDIIVKTDSTLAESTQSCTCKFCSTVIGADDVFCRKCGKKKPVRGRPKKKQEQPEQLAGDNNTEASRLKKEPDLSTSKSISTSDKEKRPRGRSGEWKPEPLVVAKILKLCLEDPVLMAKPKQLFEQLPTLNIHLPSGYTQHAFSQRMNTYQKEILELGIIFQDWVDGKVTSHTPKLSDQFAKEFIEVIMEQKQGHCYDLMIKYQQVGLAMVLKLAWTLLHKVKYEKYEAKIKEIKRQFIEAGDKFLVQGFHRRTRNEQKDLLAKRQEHGKQKKSKIQSLQENRIKELNFHDKEKKKHKKAEPREDLPSEYLISSSSRVLHDLEGEIEEELHRQDLRDYVAKIVKTEVHESLKSTNEKLDLVLKSLQNQ